MLIDIAQIKKIINDYNIDITGVLHIGAHECEELGFYSYNLGVSPYDIIWIDAIDTKVNSNLNNGIPNVYHAVITDKDDDLIDFNIANNFQSSSIFELGEKHMQNHPEVHYINKIKQTTITIDTFFKKNALNPEKYVFWNFDIQGAELLALKGAPESIKYAKIMYLEVNEAEIYKNCAKLKEIDLFLNEHGFHRVYDVLSDTSGWGDAIYVRIN